MSKKKRSKVSKTTRLQQLKKKPTKRPARRNPGRPKTSERPVTPERLEQIADRWLAGWSHRKIAEEIGVDPSVISYHLEKSIKPAWKEKLHRGAEIELAKIDNLEAIAWGRMDEEAPMESRETVTEALTEGGTDLELVQRMNTNLRRRNTAGWVAVIEWCIELRCKLLGHFAPTKVKVEEEGLRVAGKTIDELDAEMMGRLMAKITERQQMREAMRRNGYPG